MNASAQLSDEYPFNLDVNSGDPIGISACHAVTFPTIIRSQKWVPVRLDADYSKSPNGYFLHRLLIRYRVQISNGARSSSARDFIAPALSRPNLDVVVNTQVTKIVQTGTLDNLPIFSGVEFAQNASGM